MYNIFKKRDINILKPEYDLYERPVNDKGGKEWFGPLGYSIAKDAAKHGGARWKLLNRVGKRIATLNEKGTVLRY